MPMLLNFLHAELRKQGVRTYKRHSRPPVTESSMADNLAAFRADLDGWEL